ncbi:hypothetical protein MC885_002507 [Smutsia gigantea]|nr:hypothetical protein MC885_002507 [Smutsia gigantea]
METGSPKTEGRGPGTQPAPTFRRNSAYGAAGGKGAKNHLSQAHGVFVSTVFSLALREPLFILVGQQGEDACPGGSPESRLICLGEARAAEEHATTDGAEGAPGSRPWAGGGGGGGGATCVFRLGAGKLEPLLVAAGGGGRAYLRLQDRGRTQAAAEKLENRSAAPGSSGRGGAAGEGARARGEASSHPIPLPAIPLSLHRWRGRLDVEGPLSAGRPLLAGGSGGRPGLRRGLGYAWLGCGRRLRGRRRGLHGGWRRRWLPG